LRPIRSSFVIAIASTMDTPTPDVKRREAIRRDGECAAFWSFLEAVSTRRRRDE
jgi:hypothetical protein